jgi:hypothetical protein
VLVVEHLRDGLDAHAGIEQQGRGRGHMECGE